MKVIDHLPEEQIRLLNQMGKSPKKIVSPKEKPKSHNEILSRKDIEALMGTNRDTYKRNRGAIRRR